jgi:hypothetical protein
LASIRALPLVQTSTLVVDVVFEPRCPAPRVMLVDEVLTHSAASQARVPALSALASDS